MLDNIDNGKVIRVNRYTIAILGSLIEGHSKSNISLLMPLVEVMSLIK